MNLKPEWLKFLDQWNQKSSLIRSVEHSNIFDSFFHWSTNKHASVTPAKDVKRWRWNLSPLSFAQITERLSKSYLSILLMSNELILSLKTDFWPILSLSYAILFFKLWKTFSWLNEHEFFNFFFWLSHNLVVFLPKKHLSFNDISMTLWNYVHHIPRLFSNWSMTDMGHAYIEKKGKKN